MAAKNNKKKKTNAQSRTQGNNRKKNVTRQVTEAHSEKKKSKDIIDELDIDNILDDDNLDDFEVFSESDEVISSESVNNSHDLSNKDVQTFLDDDNKSLPLDDESFEPDDGPRMKDFVPEASTIYKYKKDQYADNYSSGLILLAFGVLGLFLVVLNVLKIMTIFTNPFQYIVGTSLFFVFIFWALYSFKVAKNFKNGIKEEEKSKKYIIRFMRENVTEEFLEQFDDENCSEEENYLRRVDNLIIIILDEHPDWNRDFIEKVIEDFYNDTF